MNKTQLRKGWYATGMWGDEYEGFFPSGSKYYDGEKFEDTVHMMYVSMISPMAFSSYAESSEWSDENAETPSAWKYISDCD